MVTNSFCQGIRSRWLLIVFVRVSGVQWLLIVFVRVSGVQWLLIVFVRVSGVQWLLIVFVRVSGVQWLLIVFVRVSGVQWLLIVFVRVSGVQWLLIVFVRVSGVQWLLIVFVRVSGVQWLLIVFVRVSGVQWLLIVFVRVSGAGEFRKFIHVLSNHTLLHSPTTVEHHLFILLSPNRPPTFGISNDLSRATVSKPQPGRSCLAKNKSDFYHCHRCRNYCYRVTIPGQLDIISIQMQACHKSVKANHVHTDRRSNHSILSCSLSNTRVSHTCTSQHKLHKAIQVLTCHEG